MVLMSRTADSNFPSGDIESIQVSDNIATAGFVVKLYNTNDVDKYDMASVTLFSKCRTPESYKLPTSYALHHHIQSTVWRQMIYADPTLSSPNIIGCVKDKKTMLAFAKTDQ